MALPTYSELASLEVNYSPGSVAQDLATASTNLTPDGSDYTFLGIPFYAVAGAAPISSSYNTAQFFAIF